MKKLILLISLATAAAFGQGQYYSEYGMSMFNAAGVNLTLNGAASGGFSQSWYAFNFRPLSNFTIGKIRVYVAAVNGTLGANDLVCDLYSTSGGVPGTSQMTSNTVTSVPTGAGWVEWTTFTGTTTVTAYTSYWVVIRNADATPTTNYPTVRYWTSATLNTINGPSSAVKTSTNGGTSWTNASSGSLPVYRIDSNGGTPTGFPLEVILSLSSNSTNYRIHSTQQAGISFTTPSTVKFVVKACEAGLASVGSPTGTISCAIYLDSDGSTVATSANSYSVSDFDASTARQTGFWFSPSVTLNPNTKYRVALVESTQSDTTSNYYVPSSLQISNDATSLGMLPFSGTLRGSYCSGTCGTSANWTDDATNLPSITLALDPAGEFASTGGGGGQKSFAVAK